MVQRLAGLALLFLMLVGSAEAADPPPKPFSVYWMANSTDVLVVELTPVTFGVIPLGNGVFTYGLIPDGPTISSGMTTQFYNDPYTGGFYYVGHWATLNLIPGKTYKAVVKKIAGGTATVLTPPNHYYTPW